VVLDLLQSLSGDFYLVNARGSVFATLIVHRHGCRDEVPQTQILCELSVQSGYSKPVAVNTGLRYHAIELFIKCSTRYTSNIVRHACADLILHTLTDQSTRSELKRG
jgi:hypothetical protein